MIGGTIIGRIGRTVVNRAPHLDFSIRPAGRGAPRIDPKPILDGWKLLEATAIYRASGRNVLHGDDSDGMSIGQILLLPKPQLETPRAGGRRASRSTPAAATTSAPARSTGACSPRSSTWPSPVCGRRSPASSAGHSFYTSSGNVSEHSSGNAVDIAKINGIPILGHQEPGGITEQTVRRLMLLQGTMAPAPDHLAARGRRRDDGDGRPRRPHPRRLPADVRRQQEARPAGAGGAQAGPVVRPDRAACASSTTRSCPPSPPSTRSRPASTGRASDAHAGE